MNKLMESISIASILKAYKLFALGNVKMWQTDSIKYINIFDVCQQTSEPYLRHICTYVHSRLTSLLDCNQIG